MARGSRRDIKKRGTPEEGKHLPAFRPRARANNGLVDRVHPWQDAKVRGGGEGARGSRNSCWNSERLKGPFEASYRAGRRFSGKSKHYTGKSPLVMGANDLALCRGCNLRLARYCTRGLSSNNARNSLIPRLECAASRKEEICCRN